MIYKKYTTFYSKSGTTECFNVYNDTIHYETYIPSSRFDLPDNFLEQYLNLRNDLSTIDEVRQKIRFCDWQYYRNTYSYGHLMDSCSEINTNRELSLEFTESKDQYGIQSYKNDFNRISCSYGIPENQFEESSYVDLDMYVVDITPVCEDEETYPFYDRIVKHGTGMFKHTKNIQVGVSIPGCIIESWQYYNGNGLRVIESETDTIQINDTEDRGYQISVYFYMKQFQITGRTFHVNPYTNSISSQTQVRNRCQEIDRRYIFRTNCLENADDKYEICFPEYVKLNPFTLSVNNIEDHYELSSVMINGTEVVQCKNENLTSYTIEIPYDILISSDDNSQIFMDSMVYRKKTNLYVFVSPTKRNVEENAFIDTPVGDVDIFVDDQAFPIDIDGLWKEDGCIIELSVNYNSLIQVTAKDYDKYILNTTDFMFQRWINGDTEYSHQNIKKYIYNLKENNNDLSNEFPYVDISMESVFQPRIVSIIKLSDVSMFFSNTNNPVMKLIDDKIDEIKEENNKLNSNKKLKYKIITLDNPYSLESFWESIDDVYSKSRLVMFVQMTHGYIDSFSVGNKIINKSQYYNHISSNSNDGVICDNLIFSGSCYSNYLIRNNKDVMKIDMVPSIVHNELFVSSNKKETTGLKYILMFLNISPTKTYREILEEFIEFYGKLRKQIYKIIEDFLFDIYNYDKLNSLGLDIKMLLFSIKDFENLRAFDPRSFDPLYGIIRKESLEFIQFVLFGFLCDNRYHRRIIGPLGINAFRTRRQNAFIYELVKKIMNYDIQFQNEDELKQYIYDELIGKFSLSHFFPFVSSVKNLWINNEYVSKIFIFDDSNKNLYSLPENNVKDLIKMCMFLNYKVIYETISSLKKFLGNDYEDMISNYISFANDYLDTTSIVQNILGTLITPFVDFSDLLNMLIYEIMHDEPHLEQTLGFQDFVENKFLQYDRYDNKISFTSSVS